MMVSSHLWWYSIDEYVGAENTYQYSMNVDIHSSLRGVRLARKFETESLTDLSSYTTFASIEWKLYRFALSWAWTKVYELSDWDPFTEWTLVATIASSGDPYSCCVFDGKIFLFTSTKIREFNPSWYASTDRTPSTWWSITARIIPSFNFHEAGILVGKADKLFWYDPVLLTWSIVRDFTQGRIVGIIEYEEQVGIVVNHNWYDSRIYILWGNFDVDDIGVLGTVPLPGISVQAIGQMANRVFLVAQDDDDIYVTDFYEMQWRDPVLIKSSRYTNGFKAVDFILMDNASGSSKKRDTLVYDGKYIYIPCWDGIYRYGSPNKYIPQVFTQFSVIYDGAWWYEFWQPRWYTVHGNYLYVCWISWSNICRWYLWNEPSRIEYTDKWFIKYRKYYSGSIIARNQNIRIIVWYLLTAWSSINIYLWCNYKAIELVGTITTETIDWTWWQKMMRYVLEVDNDRAEDWNVIDAQLELLVWDDDTETPEIFEFYLEHTPVLNV